MWTEQTVETLKQMALEGKSASWIAAALGAPSRNAVIGKANRIGIKLNGTSHAAVGEGPPPPSNPWGARRITVARSRFDGETRGEILWRSPAPRPRSRAAAVARERKRTDRLMFQTAEVGEMRRVGFADIGEAQCRWPLGDPMQEDFAFCGLQASRGHAYCAGHCRLVYRWP